MDAEKRRLIEAARRELHWRRWGPYLSEREWGTVREDYSAYGTAWDYFPVRTRASARLSLGRRRHRRHLRQPPAIVFRARVLERPRSDSERAAVRPHRSTQGNHGEDVKELYYYLDSTPTHSYMKCLYKYPQAEFPYKQLLEVNRGRTRQDPEYRADRHWRLRGGPLFRHLRRVRQGRRQRHPDPHHGGESRAGSGASLHVLPTLWFRNTWSWDPDSQAPLARSQRLRWRGEHRYPARTLGSYRFTLRRRSRRTAVHRKRIEHARAVGDGRRRPT